MQGFTVRNSVCGGNTFRPCFKPDLEFQAVEEEVLNAVGTRVRFLGMDLGDLRCGFFKLGKTTGRSPQLKEATLENWELALILLSQRTVNSDRQPL
jgi:hypothetical protein